jgi:hypothetical protein
MDSKDIIGKIDAFIDDVERDRFPAKEADGWDESRRAKTITLMQHVRADLQATGAGPKWSIIRTMDSWGIVSGEALVRAAIISNDLHHFDLANGSKIQTETLPRGG